MTFWRIFKYIRPQWPRVIIVFISAITIAAFLSASFVTVIPLLKVMMGEEGLHGWIDRKICQARYGIDFYVPKTVDFLTEQKKDGIAYYLVVTEVEDGGSAAAAGLRPQDKIFGFDFIPDAGIRPVVSTEILQRLAESGGGLNLAVKRSDSLDRTQALLIRLDTGKNYKIFNGIQNLLKFVPRDNGSAQQLKAVMFIIFFIIATTVIRCVATFTQEYIAEKVVEVATTKLRIDVFTHAMHLPVGFFAQKGTSDSTSRIIGDINALSKGAKMLLGKAIREPFKAAGTLGAAFLLNWQLTLIFLALAPFTIGFGAYLGRKVKRAAKKTLQSSALILGRLQDTMSALRVVKVYNRQQYENEHFCDVNRQYLKRALQVAKVDAITGPIMEMLGMLAGSAALLVGAHWVAEGSVEATSFLALLLFLGATAESVRKSSDVWNKVQQSNAAAERVFAILDEPNEYEKPDACVLAPLKDNIEFRNISFKYPGNPDYTLKNLNLIITAGQTVAIVGANGSGKTTLVNLLPRFYDPDDGAILIDGTDIRQATLKSLRDNIGMVTQTTITFNDTIANNIAYGKMNASRDEIIAAAQKSYAHEFIAPLEKGYDTIIGEHGSGLSGGQLQRIVIARAIIKNPSILIFDEAMSQIDAESEAKIHKALSEIMKGRTCIVIAHRFSTVINADKIVVVDKGSVVAQGRHEELIKTCPLYQNLYETQLINYESGV